MNYKPIIIVLGEPYSIFPEIFLKTYNKVKTKIKNPLILIGSSDLILKQMNYFGFKFIVNEIKINQVKSVKDNQVINIINVKLNQKKIFESNSRFSNSYISKSFDLALQITKTEDVLGLINGPVSKTKFLRKKYNGITEYLAKKTGSNNVAMLIYNKNISTSPLTTHIPIRNVAKKINKKLIIKKITLIESFYKQRLRLKPKIAVLGLNPHCETNDNISEEKDIIIPSIKLLKKKKLNVTGPFSADTFFLKSNLNNYNLIIGMYHDQVLTPIKTLFDFNAINITVGLPFVRISPDHGPNEKMVGKGISSSKSLEKALDFFRFLND